MLLWALAAAVPILIHWLSRRRYQQTPWAATRFLLAALRQHARRLRLEQLLLLLLRAGILLLLAVGLAEPLLTRTVADSVAAVTNTHWVLVLDGSFSMEYRTDGRTRFEDAQQKARELVGGASQGDGFTLVLMASPPQVVIREPAFDASDVLREIDALRVFHTGADLQQTLRQVEQLIERAQHRHPRLQETRVCFITDLGAATWEATESAGVRNRLEQLADKQVQVSVLEVGEPSWENAAITRLEMLDAFATVDQEVRFIAELRRLSAERPRRARVEFVVDGQPVREESVDLTTGAATLAFTHRFVAAGEHHVELRMHEDDLEVDNHRWKVVIVREATRVLCIEGEPNAARYVAYALEPRRTEQPRVRWELATETAIVERDLAQYELIVLANVARFSQQEAALLHRYVTAGGSLAFFLGNQVDIENYNPTLGAESRWPLLPVRLGEPVAPGEYRFDPLGYRHPLVAPFAGEQRAGLLTVPTWRYYPLTPAPQADVRVALAFNSGAPALIEAPIGQGRVFVFASAPTPSLGESDSSQGWSEFAAWPAFPPVMQEMLALAVRQHDAARDVMVGEPLTSHPPPRASAGSLRIVPPDGTVERVRLVSHDEQVSWAYPNTYWSGIYRARYDTPEDAVELFSVSVDTAESQLDRYDAARLPSQFRRLEETPEESGSMSVVRQQSATRYVLLLMLVLLVTESYCGWRFGSARE